MVTVEKTAAGDKEKSGGLRRLADWLADEGVDVPAEECYVEDDGFAILRRGEVIRMLPEKMMAFECRIVGMDGIYVGSVWDALLYLSREEDALRSRWAALDMLSAPATAGAP